MSTKNSRSPKRPRTNISARVVLRDPVDSKRLAGALIELALAQAEAAAQAEHEQSKHDAERKTA